MSMVIILSTVINSITEITINLSLDQNQLSLMAMVLGLSFVNQRVAQPADISDLDLNEAEFSKNTSLGRRSK